jgi:hypothetical protein
MRKILGPEHYKTYQIVAPRSTHTRAATCAEVECGNYARGFKVMCETETSLGAAQAKYIVEQSGRRYSVVTRGTTVEFIFPAGQQCFAQHRVSLEREPLFRVKGGDARGNPLRIAPTQHTNADDWVDDFANHQIKIEEARKRG